MDKYENMKNLNENKFRTITGVSRATFGEMASILKEAYAKLHEKGGVARRLSCENMLLVTLEYYTEYRSQEAIGASFGLDKSNVSRIIGWVEETLLHSGKFSLPSKRELVKASSPIEIIVVDTTEIPIQRPKRKQNRYYSGKKNDTR